MANHTTPVGRLVRGSLYKPNTKDAEGNPLVVKSGPNKGQARVDYYFAIAIAKTAGKGWWETEWGQIIYQTGAAAFPQVCQRPDFAWKIIDGDSTMPNKKGKRPCDNEGYPGHWIVGFSSGFPPAVFRASAANPTMQEPFNEADAVKPGYFVQVNFNVDGNGSDSQPGVYLNHRMVSFAGYGAIINLGMDVASAGFGQSPLPAGATATPPASAGFGPGVAVGAMPGMGMQPGQPMMQPAPLVPGMAMGAGPGMMAQPMMQPAAAAPAMMGAPQMPGMGMQPAAAAPAMMAQPMMQPAAVVPNAQFVNMPVGAGAPGQPAMMQQAPAMMAPAPAPAMMQPAAAMPPQGYVLHPQAGATYQSFMDQGWTPQAMLAQGYLLPG